MDNNISFSKIVATPTLNSWSQAYNAGKLFAVLSLEKTQDLNQDLESLNKLGRDLLEKLEQEFFTIEEKNLESVKRAISNTFENNIEGVNISFAAGACVSDILYLFAIGNGKTFIKREGNLGLLLSATDDPKEIVSSSGFLKNNDLIVLATQEFTNVITNDELNLSLNGNLPAEIAESLAPKIHKAENGKISAIIIKYGKPEIIDTVIEAKESIGKTEVELEEESIVQKPKFSFDKYLILIKSKLKIPNLRIVHRRKVFLIAAIVIVSILISSIYVTIQKQNNAKVKALFAKVYPEALKEYDEGQNLLDLNRNLAKDSFVSAQKILQDNKDKFPEKSEETIQIQDLLKKVEEGLATASGVDKSGLDRSKLSVTVQNGSGIEGTAGKAANILKEFGYNVPTTGNADNYNYEGVTIKVKKENSNFLELLKKDLAKDYKITESSSDLSSDSPTDALIIIGK